MCDFLTVHSFAFMIFLAAKEQLIKTDLQKLEGTWIVKSLIVEGKERDCASQTYTFKGNKARYDYPNKMILKGTKLRFEGNGTVQFTIVLDPTTSPKTVDFLFDDGKIRVTSRGIYSIDGDVLKLCKIDDTLHKERPTEFVSKPFSTRSLEILERAKMKR